MALRTPTFPRIVDAALDCVDFGVADDEATEAGASTAVVDALDWEIEGEGEVPAVGVAPTVPAVAAPLICAWTVGLNCPDMPLRLQVQDPLDIRSE